MLRSDDTTHDAHRAQLQVWRRMGPERRVALAARMSDDARRMTADGIRARHPGYSDIQVRFALLRVLLGDELFRAAWPEAEFVEP